MCWPFTRVCHAGLMWAPRFSFLRSLVMLGASDNGRNAVKRAQNSIAFVSLLFAIVSRAYQAYGTWLQIGKKWSVFRLKIFSCKCSVWLLKNQPVRDVKDVISVKTLKNPWNCLKSAVLTFHVITRGWRRIRGLFPFHIAFSFSNQLIFWKGKKELVLIWAKMHNDPWFHSIFLKYVK